MVSGLSPPRVVERWEKEGRKYAKVIFEQHEPFSRKIHLWQVVYEITTGPNALESWTKEYGSEIDLGEKTI